MGFPKIIHFAGSVGGGANIAGRRLHEALLRKGVESQFFIGAGDPPSGSYAPFQQHSGFLARNYAAIKTSLWARKWADEGFVVGNRWIQNSDARNIVPKGSIVCLHWVSRWLDLPTFLDSLPSGTPVVWTLHDFIPVTGGCSNPYECKRYEASCGECPQLKNPSASDFSNRVFKEKDKLFKLHNIHLVANSRWTEKIAKDSSLGQLARSISQIHYGLDAQEYAPIDKNVARQALGLPDDQKMVVGFSCLDFNDKRKGARILIQALKGLPEQTRNKLKLVVLGGGNWPSIDLNMEIVSLGATSNSRYQSIFYSSLDVFVLASTSETFGNVVIESMSCKTPVIAFGCGGPEDTVANGDTGFLIPTSDDGKGIGEKIQWMLDNSSLHQKMGDAARKRVIERFDSRVMAENYLQLFERLVVERSQ